jgi:hypothetical protein
MRLLLIVILVVHGVIHLFGFVKAFGLAEVSELHQPISQGRGILWLMAALLLTAGAVLLVAAPRHWWIPASAGIALSQVLIFGSWGDAKFGTIANLLVLIPLTLTIADFRSSSLRSEYQRDLQRSFSVDQPAPLVGEGDLARLPQPVQKYLRRVGVVGKPRVLNFRAIFDAKMRSRADAAWMSASVEQYEFFDPPGRLFFMRAWRFGVPADVYHRYVGSEATMRVRVAGVFNVTDVGGPEPTQSETVTLLNDMCCLAPATLVAAPIQWTPVDERTAKASFANAGYTIAAVLSFDANGDLVNFESDDRYQSDEKGHRRFPWSTPLRAYRDFAGYRLASEADVRWHEPSGEWIYGQFALKEIVYNVRGR